MLLNIISSNIRFDNPKDNEHAWPHRLPVLSSIINELSPTLLGTQEGWKDQQYQLAKEIPSLKLVDDHRDWIADRMYPSIWIDPNQIEIIDSGDIWLSETPGQPASISFGSAFPRLCTWAICKVLESGKELFYVNTHLDHLQTGPRQKQIEVLVNETMSIRGNRPLILTGDFNEGPNGKVREILDSKLNLNDPWQSLNKLETPSFHKFGRELKGPERIDWLLHSSEFEAQSIDLVTRSVDGIFPSDHYPVVVKLSI